MCVWEGGAAYFGRYNVANTVQRYGCVHFSYFKRLNLGKPGYGARYAHKTCLQARYQTFSSISLSPLRLVPRSSSRPD